MSIGSPSIGSSEMVFDFALERTVNLFPNRNVTPICNLNELRANFGEVTASLFSRSFNKSVNVNAIKCGDKTISDRVIVNKSRVNALF